jgi:hypothetical protein
MDSSCLKPGFRSKPESAARKLVPDPTRAPALCASTTNGSEASPVRLVSHGQVVADKQGSPHETPVIPFWSQDLHHRHYLVRQHLVRQHRL